MNETVLIALGSAALAFVLTAVFTRALISFLGKAQRLDVPNERSLHQTPTPRGGGLAIVAVFVLFHLLLSGRNEIPLGLDVAVIVGACAIAATGWVDDKVQLSAKLRLLVHLAASVGVVVTAGITPVWVAVLLVPALAWSINLYNFMDGLDGLAASQAAVFGVGAALVGFQAGLTGALLTGAVLAGCALGFLLWNRPKARIFMGDVGSGTLGFLVGSLVLVSWREESSTAVPLLILLGVFLIDATYTLVRRMLRRVDITKAHRSHAYQKAVLMGHSHGKVLRAVLAVQLLLLAPLAWMALFRPSLAWIFALLAALPLLFAEAKLRAGTEEQPR